MEVPSVRHWPTPDYQTKDDWRQTLKKKLSVTDDWWKQAPPFLRDTCLFEWVKTGGIWFAWLNRIDSISTVAGVFAPERRYSSGAQYANRKRPVARGLVLRRSQGVRRKKQKNKQEKTPQNICVCVCVFFYIVFLC